ncbi:hypothetical protein WDH52_11435 [Streptomyces sp. TRM70308]|uniref:hypothetical protein n=1 Tax=Streptomyces TaxID=1883 RepID=UPI002248C327|nr:hypothetical protein [Streptomyces sp. JHD 1]MCX2968561.1 hypothetical protein [Streptomyces sp. JHD 1]
MTTGDGTEHHNADQLHDTQRGAASLAGLSAMQERFVEIASVEGVFGTVANGAQAEAALAEAAAGLLTELERAGISVENIAGNAGTAAQIAELTDEEVAFQMRMAPPVSGPNQVV